MANTIGVIGDRDSVLLFKAVGLDVFFETEGEKAQRTIRRLVREGYRVIFMTEELYTQCGEAVAQFKSEAFPAIIPIPGNKGTRGVGMQDIKKNVEKAIGADILFSEGR
ncbi:MAG: V-type ATP synthase subunit F [Clostridiales bacterium]|jgi:V/A-type H+-transporting ATPase subunit F|nr:V-type ATP synthase subunit F [Clostridiales bacterium]